VRSSQKWKVHIKVEFGIGSENMKLMKTAQGSVQFRAFVNLVRNFQFSKSIFV